MRASEEQLAATRAGPEAVAMSPAATVLARQAVGVLALWIAVHPFRGIAHDARLYLVQAMNGANPGALSDDLYLEFGSQDSFTLFSTIYRPLIVWLGPSAAHLALAIPGQLLWVAAILNFARTLFSDARLQIGVAAAVIACFAGYGGFGIFQYGESFATPRIFAEALVLLALASALRRRLLLAGGLIALAAGLHPIMAMTGAAVLVIMAALTDRRAWLLLLGGAVVGVGLAFAHVEPFGRLLTRFDPEWFAVVLERCGFAFLTRWSPQNFGFLLSAAMLSVTAVRYLDTNLRRLWMAVLIAGFLGLAATAIGADLAHNIFVVNVQPWRTLWLVTLLANISCAVLLQQTSGRSTTRELLLVHLVLSTLASILRLAPIGATMTGLAVAIALAFPGARKTELPALPRFVARTVVVLACLVTIFQVGLGLKMWASLLPLVSLALAGLAILALLSRWADANARLLGLALAAILLLSVVRIDDRSAWQKMTEDGGEAAGLTSFIGDARQVYWEGGLELLWLKAKRPSYYSCVQGTGAMFYRATAMEYRARHDAIKPLNTIDFDARAHGICGQRASAAFKPPSLGALSNTCRLLPDLDAIVLSSEVRGGRPTTWSSPVTLTVRVVGQPPRKVNRYYRYDCGALRSRTVGEPGT